MRCKRLKLFALCNAIIWICIIVYLPKPTENTIPRVSTKVNYRLFVAVMYQFSSFLIKKKVSFWWWMSIMGRPQMFGGMEYMRNLCTLLSVFGKPETALKSKLFKKSRKYHKARVNGKHIYSLILWRHFSSLTQNKNLC